MSGLMVLCVLGMLLSLFLFIYPYAIYPLILRLLPEHETRTVENSQAKASAALLFCAYNEEQALPEKIANLRSLKERFPDLHILAYSDCSDDLTNTLLDQASDILTPILATERRGKVLGMQHLLTHTDAEVLIFTDANVIVSPESVERLLKYFQDPEIGTVGGTLIYTDDEQGMETVAKVGGMYWQLEEHIKKLESRSGSMMGADGSIFARRSAGYPDIPADLVDDMAVSMDSVINGQRCISAPDVIATEHSVSDSSEEFKRKRRIACGSYSTYRYQKAQLRGMSALNRFKYLSHKLLRWYGAFFLLAAIIFFAAACVLGNHYLLLILAALGGFTIVLAGRFGLPVFSTLYELLSAILATAIGIIESLTGSSYQTWSPAKSR